ncbi:MAG: hypothetical protein AAFY88_01190 [Acidobacteriota bacterium]
MLDRLEVWRNNPKLWALPVAFVAVNLIALVFFQTVFAGRVDALKRRYDNQAERLETLRTESERAEQFVLAVSAQTDAGDALYTDYFSSEGLRFTKTLREVRRLAREAGMNPRRFTYPEDVVEDYGLVRRGMNFPVSGTYEQLRRFINMLELTDTFITLEAVELGEIQGARQGRADPNLSVRLRLWTMYVDTEFVPSMDPPAEVQPAADDELEAVDDPDEET